MSDQNVGTDRTIALELHRVWSDQLKVTDEISLKLLAIVPTITAISISLLLPKDSGAQLATPQVIFVGLFGAWVTFLIYRWEKRNVQICGWYREKIRTVEKAILHASSDDIRQLPNLPSPPAVFKHRVRVGKARAELWIYSSAVVAWLALAGYGSVALLRK